MRKLLLATSAAALALTFAAPAGAEPNKIIPAATTVAPPETTTTDGLVFSKNADQAKPIVGGIKLYGSKEAAAFMSQDLAPLDEPQVRQSIKAIGSLQAMTDRSLVLDDATVRRMVDGRFLAAPGRR